MGTGRKALVGGTRSAPDVLGWARLNRAQLVAGTIAVLIVVGMSVRRWVIAGDARWPGHADPSFYFGVAQNLRAGRGANINYIWEFLSPLPAKIDHYAFGYWTPLVSVLMSFALRVGSGVTAAIRLNVVMSIGFAAATYLFARQVIRSPWLRATAAALVIVLPGTSDYIVTTQAPIYFATFATAAIAAATAARRRQRMWLVAGVFAGLAALSRSEGLLLIVVLALAAIIWAEPGWRRRLRTLTTLLVPFFLVMLPFFVVSMAKIGSPLPSAPSRFPFITEYENLFSLHVTRSLSAFLGDGIGKFASLRGHSLVLAVDSALQSLNSVVALALLVLAALGVGRTARREDLSDARLVLRRLALSVWFVPLTFTALVVLVDVLIAPVVSSSGAISKAMVSINALVVVAGLSSIERLELRTRTLMVLCGLLIAFPLAFMNATSTADIASNNANGDAAVALGRALRPERACLAQPMVLMTRDTWEFTQATGIPAVQIPNGSLADILRIARRYHVTDIRWTPARSALQPIGRLASTNGPLQPANVPPALRIYRVRSTTRGSTCP
jgi:hypothetical protein